MFLFDEMLKMSVKNSIFILLFRMYLEYFGSLESGQERFIML